jgi:hypothetical protein
MPDTIDLNISPVIETVALTIQPNLTTINVNTITGGGGAVDSVNALTGVVVLTQDTVLDGSTFKQYSLTEKNKLAGIAAGAEVNVNADWNAVSGDAQILNKPTIPAAQVNSDWNAVSGVAQILNKPSIPDVSTLVPYTGATANVDLGTHKLLAEDLDINHASGSGDAATITKGGNGEALKVVKTSGSGNAASITGGVTLLDELHLTTDLADAYISSAPTWNAKQNALAYTPYRFVQTSQTAHTGTTAETILATATIPAGAFNSNDVMKVLLGANKTTNLGTYTLRLRVNTTNTISGAPTIAIYIGSASIQSNVVMRNYHLIGGNLLAHSFSTTAITDIFVSTGLSSTALNPANQFFIFFTITLGNAGDSIVANMLSIHN